MRVDIVLDQARDPVQRGAELALGAFSIHCFRNVQGIWIQLQDTVELGPGFVDQGDALHIVQNELARCDLPRSQQLSDTGHSKFFHLDHAISSVLSYSICPVSTR